MTKNKKRDLKRIAKKKAADDLAVEIDNAKKKAKVALKAKLDKL